MMKSVRCMACRRDFPVPMVAQASCLWIFAILTSLSVNADTREVWSRYAVGSEQVGATSWLRRERREERGAMREERRGMRDGTVEIGDRNIPIRVPKGKTVTERELEIIKGVIKNDFLVNDDTTGSSSQYSPSVAMDGAGNFVVVWYDERNGDSDIYSQRYNSEGTAQGDNFKINDDAGTSSQYRPSVAMDNAGNFVVVWMDYRDGDYDIYSQRYNSEGTAQGDNFKINDDAGTSSQYRPSVAMDNAGNFVVVWDDHRNGDCDIYSQMYNSSGVAQGDNFRVNDDAGTSYQEYPSVAMDPEGGRFVVVWEDFRNQDGDPELVAQKYENVSALGSNVQINEPDLFPYNHQRSWRFCIACNSSRVIFTWTDNRRHKGWDIYGKLTDWELVGIEESENYELRIMNYELKAYPNPFSNRTSIEFRVQSSELKDAQRITHNPQLNIYDLSGRLVERLTIMNRRDACSTNLTTIGKNLKAGIYFLKVDGYKPMKIVKLR